MSIKNKLTLGISAIVTIVMFILYSLGVAAFLNDKKEDNLEEAYIINKRCNFSRYGKVGAFKFCLQRG